MKIAIRILLLAGLLAAGIYGQISGPGTPVEPPIAVIL
jgi:hypothetical protein